MNYNSFAPSDPVGWSAAPLVPSHSLLLLPQISSVFFPAVRPFITQHSPLWLFSFYSQPRPPLCFYPFLILSLTSTAKGVFSFQTGAEKELWQGAEREGLSVYVCVLALPAMQPQEVHCASPPPSLCNNDMSTSQSGLDNMWTRRLTGTQIFQMDHSWNTLCKNVCRQIVPFRKKQNKTKHFKQERRLQVCPSKSDTVVLEKWGWILNVPPLAYTDLTEINSAGLYSILSQCFPFLSGAMHFDWIPAQDIFHLVYGKTPNKTRLMCAAIWI